MIDTGSLWSWIPTTYCSCGRGVNVNVSSTANVTQKENNITVTLYLYSIKMGILYLDTKEQNWLLLKVVRSSMSKSQ